MVEHECHALAGSTVGKSFPASSRTIMTKEVYGYLKDGIVDGEAMAKEGMRG